VGMVLVFGCLTRSWAVRDNRLASVCVFRPPSWRPSHFSLLAQREVTKRKGTHTAAVAGLLPGAYARPLRLFPTRPRRGREGPGRSRARPSWPQKQKRSPRRPALAFAPLLTLGPSVPRRRADGRGPRAPHAGEREGSRSFGCGTWMCRQPSPGRPQRTVAKRRRDTEGVFSLVTFSCTSKRK
jgi:hypothetical protein